MADELHSLAELRCMNCEASKKCSMGLIIDATAAYKPTNAPDFMCKIKLIDASLNQKQQIENNSYCTVMLFAKTAADLPHPSKIGQVLYLRRYNFNTWEGKFQAKKNHENISSWVLFKGGCNQLGFGDYQASKPTISLNDEKYTHLVSPLRELRAFGRKYLAENSLAHTTKVQTKDKDWILRVKDSIGHNYTFTNGYVDYHMELNEVKLIGSVVKIRSIDRVEDTKLIRNDFTSVIEIEDWMKSYKELTREGVVKPSEDKQFSTFKELLSLPNSGGKQLWNVKGEVLDISPKNFKDAVRNYNPFDNKLVASRTQHTRTVYNLRILLRDSSIPDTSVFESYLFSWDGRGSDFVDGVDLSNINVSSLKNESKLFQERVNELLEESSPDRPVQVLIESCPAKSKLMFRVLKIEW